MEKPSLTLLSRIPQSLTYTAYLEAWQKQVEAGMEGLDRTARKYFYYVKYNWERSGQVAEAYSPSEALKAAMARITQPQHWCIITENWCGDSAYCLPVLEAAAALNPMVSLHLFPRDAHLDVMDAGYLTAGSRGIPKLVILNEAGDELATWGPRPAPAAALRAQWLAEGLDGMELINRLLEWYEEGGWRTVDGELTSVLDMLP